MGYYALMSAQQMPFYASHTQTVNYHIVREYLTDAWNRLDISMFATPFAINMRK